MPFGNPEREKSFRCRFTHFFAKASIFSFCVCKLKKLANMGVARTPLFAKDDSYCLSPCDRRKLKQDGIAKTFAMLTHLRGGIYASQMEEACKTSPFRRSSSERRTGRFPKAAAFGALSWFVLCRVAKNEHKCGTAHARSSVRPATKILEI